MAYCRACGEQIKGESKYCPFCGKSQAPGLQLDTSLLKTVDPRRLLESYRSGQRTDFWPAVLSCGVGAFLAALVLVTVLSRLVVSIVLAGAPAAAKWLVSMLTGATWGVSFYANHGIPVSTALTGAASIAQGGVAAAMRTPPNLWTVLIVLCAAAGGYVACRLTKAEGLKGAAYCGGAIAISYVVAMLVAIPFLKFTSGALRLPDMNGGIEPTVRLSFMPSFLGTIFYSGVLATLGGVLGALYYLDGKRLLTSLLTRAASSKTSWALPAVGAAYAAAMGLGFAFVIVLIASLIAPFTQEELTKYDPGQGVSDATVVALSGAVGSPGYAGFVDSFSHGVPVLASGVGRFLHFRGGGKVSVSMLQGMTARVVDPVTGEIEEEKADLPGWLLIALVIPLGSVFVGATATSRAKPAQTLPHAVRQAGMFAGAYAGFGLLLAIFTRLSVDMTALAGVLGMSGSLGGFNMSYGPSIGWTVFLWLLWGSLVGGLAMLRPLAPKELVPTRTRYCTKCGAANKRNVRFCTHCGEALKH